MRAVKACVFPIASYCLEAVGLDNAHIAQLAQAVRRQLRFVAADHSFQTRVAHKQLLWQHQWEHLTQLLRKRMVIMLQRPEENASTLTSDDALQTHDHTILANTIRVLDSWMVEDAYTT